MLSFNFPKEIRDRILSILPPSMDGLEDMLIPDFCNVDGFSLGHAYEA